jgi:hypothetical protein
VLQGTTQVPSVSPSNIDVVPVVATASLTIRLLSVPGPLTDLTTEAFLAACSDFYDQELPDCATDVTCEISIRRLLQRQPQRLRALQLNINVLVDVTATFEGTCDATGFEQIVSELLETNSDDFTTLLQTISNNTEVISYFQSVDIEGFDPTDGAPTLPPSSSNAPSPAPTLSVDSSLEPTAIFTPTPPSSSNPPSPAPTLIADGSLEPTAILTTSIPAMGMGMGGMGMGMGMGGMNMNGGMGMMMMMMMMGMRMNGGMGMGMGVGMGMGMNMESTTAAAAGMGMGMNVDNANTAGMGMTDVVSNRAWESFMEKLNRASSAQQGTSAPVVSPTTTSASMSSWMKLIERLNDKNND